MLDKVGREIALDEMFVCGYVTSAHATLKERAENVAVVRCTYLHSIADA